ncbi:MAG TPA: ribosomal protein S18-alanine N-acetyltransferase, partial [Acidimicrobiales bacterium]|nr:ribosomal protein S18-alanine N-acetyltransferase [Acidimicrobiales bacterium]
DPAAPPVVTLAPMRRSHLRAVVRIEERSHARPWSSALFLAELAQPEARTYLVAKVDGRVVGYGGVMYVLPEAHVTTIAVDDPHRRRAVGTRLLVALARAAIAKGANALTLEVRVGNHAAQEMYRRFGFRPAGIRKNYYVETNEDALVMWAHDVDTAEYRRRLAEIEAGIPGVTLVSEGLR